MSKTKWTVDLVKGLLYRRDGDGFTCAVGAVCSKAGELVQILRRGQAKPKICVWWFHENVACPPIWRSSCKPVWAHERRGFYTHCPGCGGKIIWKKKT